MDPICSSGSSLPFSNGGATGTGRVGGVVGVVVVGGGGGGGGSAGGSVVGGGTTGAEGFSGGGDGDGCPWRRTGHCGRRGGQLQQRRDRRLRGCAIAATGGAHEEHQPDEERGADAVHRLSVAGGRSKLAATVSAV